MNQPIKLCVMADDFGMHPAVNDGIAQAFTEGLLTDANLMAPCPAFRDAVKLAHELHLPVGFHATLTCDWDLYHWGPLTHAPSLVTPARHFKHLVELAWSEARDDEAQAELIAQVEAIEAEGLHCTHSSYHMGYDEQGRMMRIFSKIGFERIGPLRRARRSQAEASAGTQIEAYQWETSFFSSEWSLDYPRRKARLVKALREMQPGYHLWMVHPAVDHASLDEICSADYFARNWARPYRTLDLRLLLDPEIRDVVAELGIQRIPVEEASKNMR